MSLEKLKIWYENAALKLFRLNYVEAYFNPNQISRKRDVQWAFLDTATRPVAATQKLRSCGN